MAISIKSPREIDLMRQSCKLLAKVYEELEKVIRPGISTWEINQIGDRLIREAGGVPNFLNYNGFPASICTSVNEAVVHGIPRKDCILKEGDIVSLDAGVIYKGYQSDAARTHACGEISPRAKELIEVTRQSFFEAIKFAKEGNHLFDISAAVEDCVTPHGFTCVRDFVGHGIGREMHEEPQIPNFHQKRRGPKLYAGMTLAIEPMINIGRPDVVWMDDDWTIVTEDGSLSAHYENTILRTKGEPEILSLVPPSQL